MMHPKYTVTYISNACGNTDELSNQPHECVARSLYDLLVNHKEITHSVIGLEDSWGSGKSQVINILQRIIKERNKAEQFCFITYDIWSAQEDLTRRSFLDSVLNKTKNNSEDFNTKILEDDYNKLNATSIIRKTRTFPTIRFFFATLLLIPISSFIINSFEGLLGYNNTLWTYDQLKGCVHLILTLFSLFVFICSYKQELKILNSDSNKKKLKAKRKFTTIIGRMLYVFKEKDVEKEDYETIITDEPSISRFQHIFGDIYHSLKENKTLIIVFDNMDRLSDSSKLMSTWSLLHTFFAETDYQGKIWAIVPYAKQQLIELISSNDEKKSYKATEFINKTFFTTFRIPEPMMASWKHFLNEKLDNAFNPIIETDEKTIVALIFSRSMVNKQIRPRDIIVYVNKLVTLYSQHYFEEIPIGALALYAQYEDKFNKPLDAILEFIGFESLVPLFENREQLSGWLSSVYYNLPSKEAIEVAYNSRISAFLQSDYEILGEIDEKENAYKELSSHKAFKYHIEEFFNTESDYSNLKMENVFYLLNKSEISYSTRHKIYETIANQINTLKDQFSEYEYWMEYGFLNFDKNCTNTIIETLLKESLYDFESYYRTIIELLKIKEQNNAIKLSINQYISESVPDMVNFAKYLKEEGVERYYSKTKISIEVSKILKYIQDGATNNELFNTKTDTVYDLLRLLKAHNVDLSEIIDTINNASITITNLSIDEVERIYKVFNIVNIRIESIPPYTIANSSVTKFMVIPEYLACALNKLISLNSNEQIVNSTLHGELQEKTKSICKYITKYATTDNLFKLAVKSKNILLKQILQLLIYHYTKILTTSGYLLEHTSDIVELIFDSDDKILISLLDNNADNILKEYGLDCLGVDKYWISKVNKESIKEHSFLKKMSEKWIAGINQYTQNEWISIFKNEGDELTEFIINLEEDLLPIDFWENTDIENSVKESYLGYIENRNNINSVLFRVWQKHVGETVKATLANKTIDSIKNPSQINTIKLVMLIRLYIENSKRLLEDKYANSFYDDYFSRFIIEAPIAELLQFTVDNWIKVNSYSLLLSNDRLERLKTIMTKRREEIPTDAKGLSKWDEYIKILQKAMKRH